MIYEITAIYEDDYGCEERSEDEPEMVIAVLTGQDGLRRSLRVEDDLLRRLGLDESSRVTLDEAGRICPADGKGRGV